MGWASNNTGSITFLPARTRRNQSLSIRRYQRDFKTEFLTLVTLSEFKDFTFTMQWIAIGADFLSAGREPFDNFLFSTAVPILRGQSEDRTKHIIQTCTWQIKMSSAASPSPRRDLNLFGLEYECLPGSRCQGNKLTDCAGTLYVQIQACVNQTRRRNRMRGGGGGGHTHIIIKSHIKRRCVCVFVCLLCLWRPPSHVSRSLARLQIWKCCVLGHQWR